jgi:hypothetical protein
MGQRKSMQSRPRRDNPAPSEGSRVFSALAGSVLNMTCVCAVVAAALLIMYGVTKWA